MEATPPEYYYHDDGGLAVACGLDTDLQPGDIVSWYYGNRVNERHYGYIESISSAVMAWVGYLDGTGFGTHPVGSLRRTPFKVVRR